MRSLLLLCLLCLTAFTSLQAAPKRELIVNNRILAKVDGNPLSLLDVAKRMDVLFYQQFAEHAESAEARYQFYTANWGHILHDLINRELILADANEKKLPISDGDIRQEMEEIFGPDVIGTIDELGMSYDEAWQMILKDITIRRMMMYRVHNKVLASSHPTDVVEAYEEFAQKQATPAKWKYQVLTIRHEEPTRAITIASKAYRLLSEGNADFNTLLGNFAEDETSALSISKTYEQDDKAISPVHKEALSSMREGEYCRPISEMSRSTNALVYRLLYLQGYTEERIPPLAEVEEELKNYLQDVALAEETEKYITELHEYYGVDVIAQPKTSETQHFVLR